MVPTIEPAERLLRDTLLEALTSGQNIKLTIHGQNGAAIRPGSRVIDAYVTDVAVATDEQFAGDGAVSVRFDKVVCLISEDVREPDVEAALARLFEVAFRHSGQSRIVAQFLLAWWNGGAWGGFIISDLFSLDAYLAADIATVFTHLSRRSTAAYVDAYGFGPEMRRLAERYLPRSDREDE